LEEALREATARNQHAEADRLRQAIAESREIAAALDRMDYTTADRILDARRARLLGDRER
jgi:hypothetical protein